MKVVNYIQKMEFAAETTFETADYDVLTIKAVATLFPTKNGQVRTKVSIPPSANESVGDRAKLLDQTTQEVIANARNQAVEYYKTQFNEASNQLELPLDNEAEE